MHHEHCLVRTFPQIPLPRPQHQVCSCTPSARIMATQQYAPTTPDTQFASPTIVLATARISRLVLFGMDDDFSRMHSAYGLNFWFFSLEAQSGFGYNCHAIHFTRFQHTHFIPPHPFDPLFPSSCNVVVLSCSLESRHPDVKTI